MNVPYPTYTTLDQAQAALRDAEADVLADFGEDALDGGYNDIVESVAIDCTPAVRRELARVTGTNYNYEG